MKKILYELNSVMITSSETFSLILLINKVSVVIVISKTFKFEKRSQYKSHFVRPHAFFLREHMTTAVFTKYRKNQCFICDGIELLALSDETILFTLTPGNDYFVLVFMWLTLCQPQPIH